jgi:apolipoprotein N-acyltransferase
MDRSSVRPITAGLLVAAAIPPWGWWPLGLIGIAIWFGSIEGVDGRTRFRRSLLTGLAWSIPSTIWMFDLTPAGWPVSVIIFSIFLALAGWMTPSNGRLRPVAFVAAIVLMELIRWNWPFGGTPIATFAMAGVAAPFAMSARLFGSPLLAAVFVVASIAVADAKRHAWRPAAIAVGIVVAATVGGHLGGSLFVDRGESIDVAVVQGGGEQNTRADLCTTRAVFERHMEASGSIDRDVDLVLWPEDVVHPASDNAITPARCDQDLLRLAEATDRLAQLAADLDAVVVSGWFERAEDGTANLNYSIAQSPDGTVTGRYDKVRLVPFGEFVPLRSLIERFSGELPARDVRPGTGEAVLQTDVGPLGVSISWEIFFDHRARDAIGNGGEVLLNPTNGSSYWLTIVQSQQIASSRLRALETDRWLLQAAPTGFSAIISPDAEVIDRTGVSEQRVLYGTVERRTGRTPAVALGGWPMFLFALVTLGAIWGPSLLRRIRPRSTV